MCKCHPLSISWNHIILSRNPLRNHMVEPSFLAVKKERPSHFAVRAQLKTTVQFSNWLVCVQGNFPISKKHDSMSCCKAARIYLSNYLYKEAH